MFDRAKAPIGTIVEPADAAAALPLFSVDGLKFKVPGSTLLDIPVLEIPQGGPTIIMGPNGAGKSLLLRLLHGLSAPDCGTIRMGEEMLSARVCRRQAMLFQSPVILRRSVQANVEFALAAHGVRRKDRKEQANRLLRRAGLLDRARQSARSLSGGEQQKLALMRALATRPEVLLLDEPTSNLDPGAVLAIETLLQEVSASGVKLIMVTHDAGQARRLGRNVLFLHKGRVTEQTPIDVFARAPRSAEARAYLSGELNF